MPLSEKTRNLLLAPFAISHILNRCWLPGLVGCLLFAAGAWQQAVWLQIGGFILAAPIIWVYAVVLFVFLPFAVFDRIRQRLKNRDRHAS